MTLRTARLTLDRLMTPDVPVMVAYRNAPDVAAEADWPLPWTTDDAQRLVGDSVGSVTETGPLAVRLHDGRLIGDLRLVRASDARHVVGITVAIERSMWGQGVAAEVLTAVVDELFALADVGRLEARTSVTDERGQRLFGRLGFRREGRLASSRRRRDGTLGDEILFGSPRASWHRPGTELTADPHPADVALLDDRIYDFNRRAIDRHDGELLGVFRRDDRGGIEAGLTGWTWAGIGHVDVLWVHEDRRGDGIGRSLLEAAEAEMRRRGCQYVYLESHTFQAPAWYEAMGYEPVARRDDYPMGHGDVALRKRL